MHFSRCLLFASSFVWAAAKPIYPTKTFIDNNKRSDNAATTGTITTTFRNGTFFAPVQLGSSIFAKQSIPLLFDTGSGIDWAVGPNPTPATATQGKTVYRPPVGAAPVGNFRIQYANNDRTSGPTYYDTVSVAGIAATNAIFGAANQLSGNVAGPIPFSGILGLAPDLIPASDITPSGPNWIRQVGPTLEAPLFCTFFEPEERGVSEGKGVFDFGFIDEDKYTGTIQTVTKPATIPGQRPAYGWSFTAHGVRIGETAHDTLASTETYIDSGATGVLLNTVSVDAYYQNVQGKMRTYIPAEDFYEYSYTCGAQLPDLEIYIGGEETLTIPAEYLQGEPDPTDPANPTRCVGPVQYKPGPLDPSAPQALGQPIYFAYFIIHDLKNPDALKIGFADKSDTYEIPPTFSNPF
jgi:hypothetical protein